MAKYNKRAKAKTAPKTQPAPTVADAEIAETTPAPATTETRTKTPKLTRSQAAAERIEDEYAYITDDLRRVFILAAIMFALLIVLNIVLSRIG